MSDDHVEVAISAVQRLLAGQASVGETLRVMAQAVRDDVAQAAAVGLTLPDDHGRPTTAISTDDLLLAIDQGQYANGVGPCLEALGTGEVVVVDDVARVQRRWPHFSLSARAFGVRSTLSLPVIAGTEVMGALNLYATEPHAFDPASVDRAGPHVALVAMVLVATRSSVPVLDLSVDLDAALERRAAVERAVGRFMAVSGETAERGLVHLVATARRRGREVHEVADDALSGRSRRLRYRRTA